MPSTAELRPQDSNQTDEDDLMPFHSRSVDVLGNSNGTRTQTSLSAHVVEDEMHRTTVPLYANAAIARRAD